MRFNTAWAAVTSQNVTLRVVFLIFAGVMAAMSFVAAKASLKNPIIIERACYSSVLEPKTSEHSPVEIEAFIKEAVHQRFDSDGVPNSEFLSVEEFKLRAKEQEELGRRQMKQRVTLNSFVRKDGTISADTDRLISVGSIRSAFSFPLMLSLSSVTRSEANPYGLVLVKIIPLNQEASNDKQ